MRVRFERDIGGPAGGAWTGLIKSERFGVPHALVKIEAFARNVAVACDDHTADERARAHLPDPLRRQLQRAAHHPLITVQAQSSSSKFKVQGLGPKEQSDLAL